MHRLVFFWLEVAAFKSSELMTRKRMQPMLIAANILIFGLATALIIYLALTPNIDFETLDGNRMYNNSVIGMASMYTVLSLSFFGLGFFLLRKLRKHGSRAMKVSPLISSLLLKKKVHSSLSARNKNSFVHFSPDWMHSWLTQRWKWWYWLWHVGEAFCSEELSLCFARCLASACLFCSTTFQVFTFLLVYAWSTCAFSQPLCFPRLSRSPPSTSFSLHPNSTL